MKHDENTTAACCVDAAAVNKYAQYMHTDIPRVHGKERLLL